MIGECEWVLFGVAIGASIVVSHVAVIVALLLLDKKRRTRND
jgi:hypothetical protein